MNDQKSTPQSTEDGHQDLPAEELIENLTPDEKQRWSEKFLQLEYYKAISQTILSILKDFSKWTALLVSGVGTLVGGWFSLRKVAKKEKLELKAVQSKPQAASATSLERRSAHAPVSTQGSKRKEAEGGSGRADVVRSEGIAVATAAPEPEPPFNLFADTTALLTILSVVVFAIMNIKMFIFDRRKKKGAL